MFCNLRTLVKLFINISTKYTRQMRSILALIDLKKHTYSQLPFFEFLRDETISPLKRLAFAPCAASFIMSFADLNKYILRQEPTEDIIQEILNQHTYEDDFHWQWFLEDMQKLGFNCALNLNNSLEFLWGQETKTSRLLTYELYQCIAQAEPIEKLIILKAIEATANVCLSLTQSIVDELQVINSQEYKYFGNHHLSLENTHNSHSHDVHQFIEDIYISDKTKQKSIDLVEKVFELFTQWTYGLLDYAQNYEISKPLELQLELEQVSKVA